MLLVRSELKGNFDLILFNFDTGKYLADIMEKRGRRRPEKQVVNFYEVCFESITTWQTIAYFVSFQENGLGKKITITYSAAPLSWRMVLPANADSNEREEAVIRLQGILCNKDLPPILYTPKYTLYLYYLLRFHSS
jgi:hypothetical protein